MQDYFSSVPQPAEPAAWTPPPPPAPVPAATVPLPALLQGLAGVLLLVGPLLPWVEVFALGASGVDLRWGVLPLVAGVVVLASAVEGATGRVVGRSGSGALHLLAGLGAAASVVAALVVWARLREVLSGIDDLQGGLGSGDEVFGELGEQLVAVLQPHAGAGLWLVLVAGALSVGCSVSLLRR